MTISINVCYMENPFHFYEGINKFMETLPHTDTVSLDFPGGIYKDIPLTLLKETNPSRNKAHSTKVIFLIKRDERKGEMSLVSGSTLGTAL